MAQFIKLKQIGTFGNIGDDELSVAYVKVDDFPPRLHIGRWTPGGRHVRFAGFITADQARKLCEILSSAEL